MFLLKMPFISRVKWTIFIFHEWRSNCVSKISNASIPTLKVFFLKSLVLRADSS